MCKTAFQNLRLPLLCSLFAALAVVMMTPSPSGAAEDNHPVVRLETSHGSIRMELYEDKAPVTVFNFLRYVMIGFYDGTDGNGATIFHRVIQDFMIQGGGYTADLNRKATFDPIENEADNGLTHEAYTIAMARTSDPHSATSQFFINTQANPHLNHINTDADENWGYAVFGKVISGTDVVDAIEAVPTGNSDVPAETVTITKTAVEKIGTLADGWTRRIYYPLALGAGGWDTEICVINGDAENSLTGMFEAYSITGERISDLPVAVLAPSGRKEIKVSEAFPGFEGIGYVAFRSASENAYGYLRVAAGGEARLAVPAGAGAEAGDFSLPLILPSSPWWTAVSLVNTSDESRDVEIRFNEGSVRTRTIGPGGMDIFLVSDLFDGSVPAGLISAQISPAEDLAGMAVIGNTADPKADFSGIPLSGPKSGKRYFHRIVSSPDLFSGMSLANTADTACTFKVKPYSADGIAYSALNSDVESGGLFLGTFASLELSEEAQWAEVEAEPAAEDGECPFAALSLFGTPDLNLMAGMADGAVAGTSGIFPKLDQEGFTALVMINTEFSRARVTLTGLNDAGEAVASGEVSIDSRNSLLDFPENLMTGDPASATYLRFESANDKEVAVFQVNLNGAGSFLDAMPPQMIQ